MGDASIPGLAHEPAGRINSTATVQDEPLDSSARLHGSAVSIATPTPRRSRGESVLLGTPLSKQGTSVEGIWHASYSGIDVLEMEVGGVTMMRRMHDGALNATQILKLAGVDKSRRLKILEKDLGGVYEKVQGGYGKYQGTWIPFDRAVQLCQEYGVYEAVKSLLLYDRGLEDTPSREQAAARWRSSSYIAPASATSSAMGVPASPAVVARPETTAPYYNNRGPSSGSGSGSVMQQDSGDQDHEGAKSDRQKSQTPTVCNPLPPLEPSQENEAQFDHSRDIVTELFLSGDTKQLSEIAPNEQLIVDVPIDDSGHTALHWAAALGHIDLVRDLLNNGANCSRGNYAGESPLIRAVLVTNNSEHSSLGELLDLLWPSLPLVDANGRSVLHHITLTAGIRGRADASKYYLETLLEWVVKHGSDHELGLHWLEDELVNIQDYNGDTALNIAVRIGNRQIARQLTNVNASAGIPNRAGLRPVDFGITANLKVPKTNVKREHHVTPTERRKQVLGSLRELIGNLETHFQHEVESKQKLIESLHKELKENNTALAAVTEQEYQIRALTEKVEDLRRQSRSLSETIAMEAARMGAPIGLHEKFDPDQPFRVTDEMSSQLPPVLLEARIRAYEANNSRLKKMRDDLHANSRDREAKYRHVVSLCTGVAEDSVDELLGSLVKAVESDSHEAVNIDLAQLVKKLG